MTRRELHTVARPFFDCTSYRRTTATADARVQDEALHLHAEMTRPLTQQTMRYSDIKVALRLAA